MTGPDPFERIQREHRQWAARNFPGTTADQTLQGIVEELGELAQASDIPEMEDAIGDVLIYAIHHASLIGVSLHPRELWVPRHVTTEMESWALKAAVGAVGRIAHARLKRSQAIRMGEDHDASEVAALGCLVEVMDLMAVCIGRSASDILAKVWDEVVAKRDWVASPNSGAPMTIDRSLLTVADQDILIRWLDAASDDCPPSWFEALGAAAQDLGLVRLSVAARMRLCPTPDTLEPSCM